MRNDNFWKLKLNERQKRAYDAIYVAAMAQNSTALMPSGMDAQEAFVAYSSVLYDHPELFWMPRKVSFSGAGALKVHMRAVYNVLEVKQRQRLIYEAVAQIQRAAKYTTNQLLLEKATVDYIIDNCTYAINNKYNQDASSVFTAKVAQCSGFSQAFKLLCDTLNITCLFVHGESDDGDPTTYDGHAWNIVRINGKNYHVDTTFMLSSNKKGVKPYNYNYFNMSDKQCAVNHQWEESDLPRCMFSGTDELAPYLKDDWKAAGIDSVITASEPIEIERALLNAVRGGAKTVRVIYNGREKGNQLLEVLRPICQATGKPCSVEIGANICNLRFS